MIKFGIVGTQLKVSIVITTRNSGSTLEPLLESIDTQSYRNIEVIVVDNSSSDETINIAKLYTKLIYQKGPERSAQRNFGAKKASGKYLMFLDSDMILSKNVVKECVEIFKKESKDWGGIVIPERSFGEGFWAKAKILEREINEGESYFEAARFFPNKIFWEFQGYDKNLTGPEDWDLPQRIAKKYQIGRTLSYILHNEGKLQLFLLARKKYYYGLSLHKYLSKQKISIIGPKTIYFLRPAFYKYWHKLISQPVITFAMIIMLLVESFAGGLGYFIGRIKNER